MRTPKLSYCELITCYVFVKLVMPKSLHFFLYEHNPCCILVGSQEERNKMGSLFHDEWLEMNITRHLKALCYSKFSKLCEALAWLKEFGAAFESLSLLVGGRVGRYDLPRHNDFGDDCVRSGYDRTSLKARNIYLMVQRMHWTSDMGIEFLKEEHISNHSCGHRLKWQMRL